jgi:hypothetical protein
VQYELDEIRRAAERTSPMFDSIAHGAPVTASVRHEAQPANPVEA